MSEFIVETKLSVHRCSKCERFFAIEKDQYPPYFRCPSCVYRIQEERIGALGRRIVSLRGHITRLKNKIGGRRG